MSEITAYFMQTSPRRPVGPAAALAPSLLARSTLVHLVRRSVAALHPVRRTTLIVFAAASCAAAAALLASGSHSTYHSYASFGPPLAPCIRSAGRRLSFAPRACRTERLYCSAMVT